VMTEGLLIKRTTKKIPKITAMTPTMTTIQAMIIRRKWQQSQRRRSRKWCQYIRQWWCNKPRGQNPCHQYYASAQTTFVFIHSTSNERL
jgi:hypothetical protein